MADNPSFPVGTASIVWYDSSHNFHMRVYSTDGYTITERCNDGDGWTTGFSCNGSNVSAVTWADSAGQHIRLYATYQDTTTEWCNDPTTGWTQGSYTQP
jgi:hypothetical protein